MVSPIPGDLPESDRSKLGGFRCSFHQWELWLPRAAGMGGAFFPAIGEFQPLSPH